MPTTTIILSAIIVGIAVLFLFLKHTNKPNSGSLRLVGERLGFSYAETDNSILDKIKFFKIYDITTRNASAHEVLRSTNTPPDICIFDYEATTGTEDAPATDIYTTFYFNDDRMKLPGFRLLPEKSEIAIRNNSVLKYRPISFASHPVFSTRFRLVGPDDHEIREFFKPEIREFFEKQGELCVEGFRTELLVYQPGKTVVAANFEKNFKLVQTIYKLFFNAAA
jgi:hypothetical protein